MTSEEIIDGLKFTVDMFLFDPTTGETYKEPQNNMDKTTIDACKGAIELLEQARWIPVSEGLPEDTQPVLLTIRRMSRLYNHEPFITVGHVSWNQTTWWCAHDGDCILNEIEVLAWMPLPEPYQEGEKNEHN